MKGFTVVLLTAALLAAPALPADAAPEPPSITAPSDGASYCGGPNAGALELTGTLTPPAEPAEPFLISVYTVVAGQPQLLKQGSASEDNTTWTMAHTFPSGTYEIYATASDGTEESEASAHVTFTVDAADRIGSVARSLSAFSPRNADGYKDTVTFATPVSSPGSVRYQVLNGSTVVQQKTFTDVSEDTTVSWTWNGKGSLAYNNGTFVGSGTYTIAATWLRSGCASELATTSIVVDNVKPSITSFSDTPSTFYPREDDELTEFKDTMTVKWTGLSEPAYVKLFIYRNDTNDLVRVISAGLDGDGGSGAVRWNGRTPGGKLFPAGVYEYALRVRDKVGNVRTFGRGHTRLSHKRLDARSVTVRKDAEDYGSWRSNTDCADIDRGLSEYADGVWLSLIDCYDDTEVIAAEWLLKVPAAPYYHSFRLHAYGFSNYDNHLFGLLYDYRAREYETVGIAGDDEEMHYFSRRYGSRFVRSDGYVRVALVIGDEGYVNDYDLRDVRVRVVYGVLV